MNISEDILIDFLKLILRVEGSITLEEFKIRVARSFELTDYDLSISSTRPNELMYEQRCRNLISHGKIPSSMIRYSNHRFSLI